jgi:hypothetical protein
MALFFLERKMKHLLLILCLVSFNALQTSMAAAVLKSDKPSQPERTSIPSMAGIAASEETTTAFSIAPITPDFSSHRSGANTILASANCFTFFINVGGIWMSRTICW